MNDVRIAAMADIHGNTPALLAVLARIDQLSVDIIVNLGDIASGGVDPRGTVELLRARTEIVTIRGNHDRQATTLPRNRMSATDRLAATTTTADDRAWLRELPATAEPVPGVLAFHGSPADDLCYLAETVEPTGVLREATDAEVVRRLGDAYGHYAVYLCGHTHLPRTRRLPDGTLLVNPGSVGWPAYDDDLPYPHRVETGTPQARFAVIELDGSEWSAEHFAIDYDHEDAARTAEVNGRPDVAHQLRFGRAG